MRDAMRDGMRESKSALHLPVALEELDGIRMHFDVLCTDRSFTCIVNFHFQILNKLDN